MTKLEYSSRKTRLPAKQVRLPIFFLTALTIAPTFLLVIYFNFQQLGHAKELRINNLKNIAKLVATENLQINEGARQLLISLSTSPEIKSRQCQPFLANLLGKYKRYINFSVADSQGNVWCSAVTTSEEINISERYSFRETLATNDFTVGEYTISPITKRATLNFGYPLSLPRGVIYASLNLSWLNEFVTNLQLEEGMVILILDKNGTILARNSESENWVGQSFLGDPLIAALNLASGVTETFGIDGVRWIYAYEKIGESAVGPYVVVGITKTQIAKIPSRDFLFNLLLSTAIGIISLIIGWYFGNYLLTKVVTQITKVDRLKRDFVSLVSHQLRTPLTAIKYFSQILLSTSPGKLTKTQKEFLNDTLLSTNRLIFLVGTLLNISKLESGEIVLNLERNSLNDLLKKVFAEQESLFLAKKLKFVIKEKPKVPVKIMVDPKLISQVIANLLTNAARYSSPKTQIEVKISEKNNFVIFSLQNKGFGIKEADKEFIFTKFFRSQDAGKADSEGSGLGLYLNKLIIEAHGGKIWFTSNKGTTTFYFTLPKE